MRLNHRAGQRSRPGSARFSQPPAPAVGRRLEGDGTGRVVAVLLPGTCFFLREAHKSPVAKMRELGIAMALATDFNPGSCPMLAQAARRPVWLHSLRNDDRRGAARDYGQRREGVAARFRDRDAGAGQGCRHRRYRTCPTTVTSPTAWDTTRSG